MRYKYLLVVLAGAFLTSCVSIFNNKDTRVFLYTENPTKVVYKGDTIQTEYRNGFNALHLTVPRSKDSLSLTVVSDSVDKVIRIPSKISSTYHLEALSTLGYSLLINWKSPKRYTYKSPLVLNDNLNPIKNIPAELKKDLAERKKLLPSLDGDRFRTYKGDIFLNLTFPTVNYFTIKPSNKKRKDSFGFLGIGLGLDYYYQNNRFLSLIMSGSMDNEFPVPVGIDYFDEIHEHIYSLDVLITHNHKYKRFTYGYGLAFAQNTWNYNGGYTGIHHKKHTSALGAGIRSHYYLSSKFTVGLIYRPTFVVLKSSDNKTFKYEHLLSIDFALKFRVKKGKQR